MVKIGPVGKYKVRFTQELVPETETELKNIIKACIQNKYPFFVDIFDEPREATTAIGKVVFKVKWCVLVDKSVTHDIIDFVENQGLLKGE